MAQVAVNRNSAWPIVCQGEKDKWAILPNKQPRCDTMPGSGENVRPLVILVYGVYMSLLCNIRLMKEPVVRDLGADIQCPGESVGSSPRS